MALEKGRRMSSLLMGRRAKIEETFNNQIFLIDYVENLKKVEINFKTTDTFLNLSIKTRGGHQSKVGGLSSLLMGPCAKIEETFNNQIS